MNGTRELEAGFEIISCESRDWLSGRQRLPEPTEPCTDCVNHTCTPIQFVHPSHLLEASTCSGFDTGMFLIESPDYVHGLYVILPGPIGTTMTMARFHEKSESIAQAIQGLVNSYT